MGSEGRTETLIIVNPAAHNVPSRKRLDEAERWRRSQGWQVEWRQTEGPRQATELAAAAAARGLPLLFVCGGDGTLNEAANGLAGRGTALGPRGSPLLPAQGRLRPGRGDRPARPPRAEEPTRRRHLRRRRRAGGAPLPLVARHAPLRRRGAGPRGADGRRGG